MYISGGSTAPPSPATIERKNQIKSRLATLTKQRIHNIFVPKVLCLTSSKVEEQCQKNHLTFLQLLAPFCIMQNGAVPVRTPSQSYSVEDFRVKLLSSTYFQPVVPETAEKELKIIANEMRPSTSPDKRLLEQQIYSVRDIKRYLKRASEAEDSLSSDPTPWYTEIIDTISKSMNFQPHEQFDQPLSQMLVISSAEPDPVATLKNLQLGKGFPKVLKNGQFSAQIPKFVVVVHDTCESHLIDPRSVLRILHGYFRPEQCKLITINSLPPTSPNLSQPDMWTKEMGWMERRKTNAYRENVEAGKNKKGDGGESAVLPLGSHLSPEDMMGLQKLMTDVVTKGVIVEMERRMFTINQEVNSSRKGLKNTFKSWFKSKETKRRRSTEDPVYDNQSIECQIRLLGDLAFMVRDYELALSMYRMVKDDFRNDRAWHHFASACEMIGICIFLSNGPYKEMIYAFDGATGFHLQPGGIDELPERWTRVRCRTRAAILAGEILSIYGENEDFKSRCKFLEKAAIVEKENRHGGEHLVPALLHEQIALSKLKVSITKNTEGLVIPCLRTSGRHFLLAGFHYAYSFNMHHSFHSYGLFAKYYTDFELGWPNLANHIHHWLGRQLSALGSNKLAADSLTELINSGNIDLMPIQHQGNVLSDYFRVVACTTKAKDGDGYKMKLPIFYDNELTVLILENAIEDKKFLEEPWSFSAQPRRGNSNTTYNVNTLDEAWEDCEDAIERLDGGWKALQKPKLPKLKKKSINQEGKAPQWCSIAETVTVIVYCRNPLEHDLKIVNMSLNVKYDGQNDQNQNENIELFPIPTILIRPMDKISVELKFRPLKEGLIRVLGLKYELEGLTVNAERIKCQHMFDIKGRLLNNNRQNASTGAREVDVRNLIDVVGFRPYLAATIDLKINTDKTRSGEISSGSFNLKNIGKVPINTLSIFCNESSFLMLDNHAIQGTNDDGVLYKLPLLELSGDGGMLVVPFYTCTPKTKKPLEKEIYIIIKYANVTSDGDIKYKNQKFITRQVRMKIKLNILPSITLLGSFRSVPGTPTSLLLSLNVRNDCDVNNVVSGKNDEVLKVDAVYMLSPNWDFKSLEGNIQKHMEEQFELTSGESWNSIYKIDLIRPDDNRRLVISTLYGKDNDINANNILNDDTIFNVEGEGKKIKMNNPIGKKIIIDHAEAYQTYVAAILLEDNEDTEDTGPKTIQEIRERADQRRATIAVGNSKDGEGTLPVPWSEEAFLWGPDPGINLFCLWRSYNNNDKSVFKFGLSSSFKLPSIPITSSSSNGCPLRLSCEYTNKLHHDFEIDGACSMDIQVQICHERLTDKSQTNIGFVFEANDTSDNNTAIDYKWLGDKKKSFVGPRDSLKVGGVISINLKVLFLRKGLHDLNNFTLTILNENEKGQGKYRFENLQFIVEVV